MPKGGKREGAGRKPKRQTGTEVAKLIEAAQRAAEEREQRDQQEREERDRQAAQAQAQFQAIPTPEQELLPTDVLRSNMVFYFKEAGKWLAAIKELPALTREQRVDAQFAAMQMLADSFRMRDKAGDAAVALARYEQRQLAPKPYAKDEDQPKPDDGVVTYTRIPSPPGVREILERAAQGLPPEPRKTL